MAILHACRFAILVIFFLPTCLHARTLSHKFSFQLHLQRPPLNPSFMQQPLTPFLFSAQPVVIHHDNQSSLPQLHGGRADGLYLADSAASMELRDVFFTVTLHKYQGGHIAQVEAEEEGSLVLMGSLDSGAVAVVGGTRSFAFARGQAKVSMAPGGSSEELVIIFDVELQSEEDAALS